MKKNVVCLIGPSGVGKSFYAKLMVEKLNFARPKTVTTRKSRSDDDNHIYVSKEEFLSLIAKGDFLEWDEYSGNYYGIMLDEFLELVLDEKNKGIVMDLTLEGSRKIREFYEETIFIALLPDDISWLKRRLNERSANSAREIEKRMKISERDIGLIQKMDVSKIYCEFDPENTSEVLEKIILFMEKQLKD